MKDIVTKERNLRSRSSGVGFVGSIARSMSFEKAREFAAVLPKTTNSIAKMQLAR
jgi:hypothetical protein